VGFSRIAEQLDDLTLDSPHAPALFRRFLARARADDVLEDGTDVFPGEVDGAVTPVVVAAASGSGDSSAAPVES